MFKKLSLHARLTLIVIAALVGMLATSMISAINAREALKQSRMDNIKNSLQVIYSLFEDLHAQEKAGKITTEVAQETAKNFIRKGHYGGNDGKTEYFYAWDFNGMSVAHLKREMEGKNWIEKLPTLKESFKLLKNSKDTYQTNNFPRPGGTVPVPKIQYLMKFEDWNWFIGTGVYIDDLDQIFKQHIQRHIMFISIPLVIIAILTYFVSRSIMRQIGGEPRYAAKVMQKVAEGDLTVEVHRPPVGSLLHALASMTTSLRGLIHEIHASAGKVLENTQKIAQDATEITTAAHRQSEATINMAAAIQQLGASSEQISMSAEQTEADAQTSIRLAGQGNQLVLQATEAIQRTATTVSTASKKIHTLQEKADQISSIANTIKEIADQTNLLALNAAIEAAHAGEHGRGFAVVADEVRKLAERSGLATTEIEQMIAGIQQEITHVVETMNHAIPEVQEGVDRGNLARQALQGIETGSREALDRIEDIAIATKEQTAASSSISVRVEEIAQMAQSSRTIVEKTGLTIEDLQNTAANLKNHVERFHV